MPVIPENIINLQTDSVPQTIINIDISDSGAIFAEIALAQANIATQSANTAEGYANTAQGYANDASHSADVAEGHSDDASAAADRSEAARDAAEELIPGVGRVGDFLQKTVDGAQWATIPGGSSIWGGITGDIRNQTDLQGELAQKFNNPVNTGTTGQLLSRNADGDGEWVNAPNSAVWGLIQGNIKEQTDLQNEFEHGVELTKAEYDALPASKETDNVNYWIKDGTNLPAMSVMSANGVMYDNTDSGMTSTTVQGAIDENASAINGLIGGMGTKLLWSGNFTGSGSITVDGLSDWLIVGYTMYETLTNIEYLMIGTPSRGGLPYGVYDATSTVVSAYRFLVSGDTITVNSANRGLYFSSSTTYNNGAETHIRHIFGIIKKPTSN